MNQERRDGLNVLGLLDYSNTWGYPDHGWMPHADMRRLIADYTAYVYAVVRHFRGRIRAWQIWNEPDLPMFWKPAPNPSDYARLLDAAYGAVKRADPTSVVVMAGMSGVDLPFLRAVVARRPRFDVISIHPYRTAPENQLIAEVKSLRSMRRPIWFSEIGWPAGAGCYVVCTDEAAQAAYLVRFYALAAATGVQRVFWYDLRDDPHTPASPEAHYGLLRRDLSAKPSFLAYARLTRLLAGARFERADGLGTSGLYAVRFRTPGGPLAVLWNVGPVTRIVRLRWRADQASVIGLDDTLLDRPEVVRGRVTVEVGTGAAPVFVVVRHPLLRLPPLGPLLHFAPPATPTPTAAPRPTPTRPGGAWAVSPRPTARATPQPTAPEHRVPPDPTSTPRRRRPPTLTATALPAPEPTAQPAP